MARRKTKGVNLEALEKLNDLPELSPQRYIFATKLMEGLHAADAYEIAFPSDKRSRTTAIMNACKLRRDPEIQAWMSSVRIAMLEPVVVDLEDHVKRLRSVGEEARVTGNYGAAVQAENYAGKAMGLYVDKIEDVTKHSSSHQQLISSMKQLFGPDMARLAAKKLGFKDLEPIEAESQVTDQPATHCSKDDQSVDK